MTKLISERERALQEFMTKYIRGKEPITDKIMYHYIDELQDMIVSDKEADEIANRMIELDQKKSPEFDRLYKLIHFFYYHWDIVAGMAEKDPKYMSLVDKGLGEAMLGDYEEIKDNMKKFTKKYPTVAPTLKDWKKRTDDRLRQEKLENAKKKLQKEKEYQERKAANEFWSAMSDFEEVR